VIEAIEPVLLSGTHQLRLRIEGQRQEVILVPPADRVGLVALGELLEPVLPDRLEHLEARLALVGREDAQEALVDEGRQAVDDVDAEFAVRVADRGGAFDRRAADEDREAPEERALGLVEEVVAPVDRAAKGPLPADVVAACDAVATEIRGPMPKYNR